MLPLFDCYFSSLFSRVCGNRHGLIRKYSLNMCRQCFRQYANDIGFKKVRPFQVDCIVLVEDNNGDVERFGNCHNSVARAPLIHGA